LALKAQIAAIDARLVCSQNTGDSSYWAGLLYGLASIEQPHRILLISNTPKPQGIPDSERFTWIYAPGSGRKWSLINFPLTARRLKADAIHTQYSLSPLAGRNGFTTIHDVSFMIGPEWFKPRDRFILRRTVPVSIKRAKGVFAVSETDKSELIRYYPYAKGKITTTFNACPPWINKVPKQEAKNQIEKELGITGPFVLTVGTRWPRKNMKLACDAASLLPKEIPHRLVVTGKQGWGPEELGFRGLATGYVSNETMSALYSAADLYLAPSFHEGFGIPLLEAFRCGCPVMCSTGGALPEIAANAALVVPSWEPKDWAKEIQSLLADSSKIGHLTQAGEKREKDFSWEKTAQQTLNAYFGASE
jgi:glycosyltransferase involved in cell wall biosynthesis